ncbi:MAG TPA: class I SAM-dependent methyltransferase [Blastocatellia bacterium]|jgi:cyclopropane fatty-acyl-phospholipid synthase-like methyltransferase|nr:class I SAM-dependent methyltransferase [Blastocatellia bacterium]
MKLRKSLLFILLTLPLLFASAQERQQPSGQSRGGRSAEEYVKLLESERRIEGLQVDKVVETLKVRPDDRVCDIGSGSGLFTRPMARKANGKGVVYAVDIDSELLKHVERTAQEQKLTNIKPILASETDPKLPEPVDLITIIDTMHHIGNRGEYLKGLKKYLKPGGRVAVIDFSRDWPAGHEKMVYTVSDLDGWMAAAGFKRVEQHDFLDNNFFVVYQ